MENKIKKKNGVLNKINSSFLRSYLSINNVNKSYFILLNRVMSKEIY